MRADPQSVASELSNTQQLGFDKPDTTDLDTQTAHDRADESSSLSNLNQALGDQPAAPLPEPFTQPKPENHMEGIMKSAPYLMALALLGGKATRTSSMAMMGGINGIMQGLIQGNDQAYADSVKQYNQAYKEWADRQKQKDTVFKEMLTAYKGRVDAAAKAAEAAHRAVGDDIRTKAGIDKDWQAQQRLQLAMENSNRQLANTLSLIADRKARETNTERRTDAQLSRWNKIDAKKATTAHDAVAQIDDLIGDLESAKAQGKWVAGARGTVKRVWESIATNVMGSDDTTAHDFEAKMSALLLQLPKLITGTSKSAKDERSRVEKIVSGLNTGSSPDIALSQLKIVRDILTNQEGTGETRELNGKTYIKTGPGPNDWAEK